MSDYWYKHLLSPPKLIWSVAFSSKKMLLPLGKSPNSLRCCWKQWGRGRTLPHRIPNFPHMRTCSRPPCLFSCFSCVYRLFSPTWWHLLLLFKCLGILSIVRCLFLNDPLILHSCLCQPLPCDHKFTLGKGHGIWVCQDLEHNRILYISAEWISEWIN